MVPSDMRGSWLHAVALLVPLFLYAAGYAVARSTHRLVQYEAGCIGQPNLHPDYRACNWTCSDFHDAERARGRNTWQIGYAPVVAIEEWLRRLTGSSGRCG